MRRHRGLDPDPIDRGVPIDRGRSSRRIRAGLPGALVGPLLWGALLWTASGCADPGEPSGTQQPDLARADSTVAAWVDAERVPGAVLLVRQGDEVLLERAYGHARLFDYGEGQYDDPGGIRRLEAPVPMTVETAFDLASVTKVAATTLAVMLLVDAGELDLDAPVANYLPDFRGGGKDDVTLRHLLTHTGGLTPWMPTYYHAADPDEAYAYVRDLPLAGAPGGERRYSDLGFMLLGRIVEARTGRPLDAFLAEELYAPLGLRRTGFRPAGAVAATSHGNPYERRMVHDPAFGYTIDGDPDAWDGWRRRTLVGEVNDGNAFHAFGGVAGHAGLFSTAGELATLVRLVAEGGGADGAAVFTPGTVERFLEEQTDGQALGWLLPDYAPRGAFGHTGFTGTFVLAHPGQRVVAVLLTNRQNVGVDAGTRYPDVGPLQRAVARAVFGPAPDEAR